MSHRRSLSPVGSDNSRDARGYGGPVSARYREYPTGGRHDRRTSHDRLGHPAGPTSSNSSSVHGVPPSSRDAARDRERAGASSRDDVGDRSRVPSSTSNGRPTGRADSSAPIDLPLAEDILRFANVYSEQEAKRKQLQGRVDASRDWISKNPGRSDAQDKLRKVESDRDAAARAMSEAVEGFAKAFGAVLGERTSAIKAGVDTNRYQQERLLKEQNTTLATVTALKKIVDRLEERLSSGVETSDRARVRVPSLNDLATRMEELESSIEHSRLDDRVTKLERTSVRAQSASGGGAKQSASGGDAKQASPTPKVTDTGARSELKRHEVSLKMLTAENAALKTTLEQLQSEVGRLASERALREVERQAAPAHGAFLRPTATLSPHPPPSSDTPPSLPPPPPPGPPPPPPSAESAALASSTTIAPDHAQVSAADGAAVKADQALVAKKRQLLQRLQEIETKVEDIEEKVEVVMNEIIPSEVSNLRTDFDAIVDNRNEENHRAQKLERRKRRRIEKAAEEPSENAEDGRAGAIVEPVSRSDNVDAPRNDDVSVEASGAAASASRPQSSAQGRSAAEVAVISSSSNAAAVATAVGAPGVVTASDDAKRSLTDIVSALVASQQLVSRDEVRKIVTDTPLMPPDKLEQNIQQCIEQRLFLALSTPATLNLIAQQLQQRGFPRTADIEISIAPHIEKLREDYIGLRDKVKEKLIATASQVADVKAKVAAVEGRMVAVDAQLIAVEARVGKKLGRLEIQSATQGALFSKFIQQLDPLLAHGPAVFNQVVQGSHQMATQQQSPSITTAAAYRQQQQQLQAQLQQQQQIQSQLAAQAQRVQTTRATVPSPHSGQAHTSSPAMASQSLSPIVSGGVVGSGAVAYGPQVHPSRMSQLSHMVTQAAPSHSGQSNYRSTAQQQQVQPHGQASSPPQQNGGQQQQMQQQQQQQQYRQQQ